MASSGLADASRFFSGSSSGFFGPHLEQALAIFLDALAHLDQSYTAAGSSLLAHAASMSAMAASQSGLPLGFASSALTSAGSFGPHLEQALAIFLDASEHFFQSYTAAGSSLLAHASDMSAMAASQSGLPLGFASSAFASAPGGTLAHLSANALDAAAHLDQSNVAQSFGAHDAFMSSMAASHSGDLAASGPAPKTFLNTATRSIMWGPGPCGGPCGGPLGAHFSKTSLNSSAHSSFTNSNLAIACSLVIVPASKAALMAPILVAHSSLTSAISSRHFLTHGGLGPNGGRGPGWGP